MPMSDVTRGGVRDNRISLRKPFLYTFSRYDEAYERIESAFFLLILVLKLSRLAK